MGEAKMAPEFLAWEPVSVELKGKISDELH